MRYGKKIRRNRYVQTGNGISKNVACVRFGGMNMERKDAIRGAYRITGGNNFYDGMITCSTLSGKAVCRLVWGMNKAECDNYLEKALSGTETGRNILRLFLCSRRACLVCMPERGQTEIGLVQVSRK